MPVANAFFKFAAKAALNAVGAGVGGDFAFEVMPEVASALWGWWGKGRNPAQLRQEIQQVSMFTTTEIKEQTRMAVADASPAQQHDLKVFLSMIPNAIRRSQRRASDPSGRSVSPNLALNRPESLLPFLPTRVPRFRAGERPLPGVDLVLCELLGMGGFGEVWKAKNPRFDGVPPVALKFCLDREAREQLLLHEAETLNRVMRCGSHPGIVRLQNSYLSADPPFLAYDFVAGGELSSLIRDSRPSGGLPPRQSALIVQELAEIVAFAHRLKPPIVHRDLKPANALVQSTQGKVSFRITDFGIGGVATGQAIAQTKLGTTTSRGLIDSLRGSYTPLYASPQQMAGMPPDPRDDVFALGVIWFQLLTGELETGRPGGSGWKRRLAEKGLHEEMIDLLESCFEENRSDRPDNADILFLRLSCLLKPGTKPSSARGGKKVAPQDWMPRKGSETAAVLTVAREMARQGTPVTIEGVYSSLALAKQAPARGEERVKECFAQLVKIGQFLDVGDGTYRPVL
jgi:hypothetical protein